MKTIKIEVYGRVQGIGFRAAVKDYCDGEGIEGYVMNLDDGNVEIVARGSEDELRDLVDWLKNSPGMSKVERVEEKEIDWGKFEGFEIRREGNFFSDKKRAFGNLVRRI